MRGCGSASIGNKRTHELERSVMSKQGPTCCDKRRGLHVGETDECIGSEHHLSYASVLSISP